MADPPHRQRWLAVRECGDQQALVAIDSSGQITVLDDRFDFYSAAALSPDGKALAWVSWQLPDMPWDRSMLCLVRLGANGDVRDALVAEPPGGGSVQQPPQFDDSQLWVQSDHLAGGSRFGWIEITTRCVGPQELRSWPITPTRPGSSGGSGIVAPPCLAGGVGGTGPLCQGGVGRTLD